MQLMVATNLHNGIDLAGRWIRCLFGSILLVSVLTSTVVSSTTAFTTTAWIPHTSMTRGNAAAQRTHMILSKSWPLSQSPIFRLDMTTSPSSSSEPISSSLQPIRRYRNQYRDPIIAIIGRPNVGKSALVNRIAGTHQGGAIVADEPGITRDRTYRLAEFLGERFQIVDTGGLVFQDDEGTVLAKEIREQAMIAVEESSAVIMVTDGQTGLTTMDSQIASFLRKDVLSQNIPVVLAVNKCESVTTGTMLAAQFWELGLGEPHPVSALHGVGTAELLESAFEKIVVQKTALQGFGTKVPKLLQAKAALKHKGPLPDESEEDYKMRKYGIGDAAQKVLDQYEEALAAFDEEERPEEINVAIIGRPNVGKSSLLNAIFGGNRAIVSDMAGTTRDSIDAVMERPPPPDRSDGVSTLYRFVDTAGIRRKSKIDYGPEFSWSIEHSAPFAEPMSSCLYWMLQLEWPNRIVF